MSLTLISTPPKPPRKSARGAQKFTVTCSVCDEVHGEYEKKDIPKAFTCSKCSLGQTTAITPAHMVGHTHRRDYPEGYFDQN